MVEIASEISRFGRASFEVRHCISVGGERAVEGTETRVWAAADPDDATRLRPLPIPAEVRERFTVA
jgi:acyl-CoA thioesterase FadM